eukprot:CAMPEP_0204250628 /NCGR_PEP_ID=MMETSP0361-20130328/100261_1 /ASSEMBLY_ACC=CAM_ASM_000343 /TAXON_ID=268821 /ORGANISM="Scrippsiella Hangoei, Strain SHTV-5" /LENGTH=377 /DNA_ID=CAMNT_0051223897 /DNA_START=23 /DNA_END=1155 /DNA_ORIENTATION=+
MAAPRFSAVVFHQSLSPVLRLKNHGDHHSVKPQEDPFVADPGDVAVSDSELCGCVVAWGSEDEAEGEEEKEECRLDIGFNVNSISDRVVSESSDQEPSPSSRLEEDSDCYSMFDRPIPELMQKTSPSSRLEEEADDYSIFDCQWPYLSQQKPSTPSLGRLDEDSDDYPSFIRIPDSSCQRPSQALSSSRRFEADADDYLLCTCVATESLHEKPARPSPPAAEGGTEAFTVADMGNDHVQLAFASSGDCTTAAGDNGKDSAKKRKNSTMTGRMIGRAMSTLSGMGFGRAGVPERDQLHGETATVSIASAQSPGILRARLWRIRKVLACEAGYPLHVRMRRQSHWNFCGVWHHLNQFHALVVLQGMIAHSSAALLVRGV